MNFEQAGEKFGQLKAQFGAGKLTEAEFRAQLQELMVQDEQGSWWMIGYETERWYRHDGTSWVQADPPGSPPSKSAPVVVPASLETTGSKGTKAAVRKQAAPAAAAKPAREKAETEPKRIEPAQRLAAQEKREAPAEPAADRSRRSLYSKAAAGVMIFLIASIGGYSMLRSRAQGSAPVPTPTIITTVAIPGTGASRTPPPTPSQTPEATASAVYSVSIAVSRASLYKGPALEYGLVVPDPYPRGTNFTVIARTPSGLWFLSQSPDGIEGWLYKDWIESDSDLSLVPTPASLPPPPPTATRRPKDSKPGNPKTPCVFNCP